MLNKLKKIKIESLLIVLIAVLAIIYFYYPIIEQIPVGTDAATYINEANWIVNNGDVPIPYQPTYYGFIAYVAPFTSLNIALLQEFTGLETQYPIMSIYQIFLILLLVFTSFLIGKIYSRLMSILLPIALLGSFSIIRLFMGSTVSNLLAFVFVSFIYYIIHQYVKNKNKKFIALMLLSLISLYLTHKYLTAPAFFVFIFFYAIYLFIVKHQIRTFIFSEIKKIGRYPLGIIIISAVSSIGYLIYAFYPVIVEGITAFWQTNNGDKFRGEILTSQYGGYLGPILFSFALIGIAFYVIKIRKHLLSFRVFPLFWIVILLVILQTYRLGIDFYYERIVFLAGVFIPLFAAYYIDFIVSKNSLSIKFKSLIVSFFIILITVTGVNRIVELYNNSNVVTKTHIEALQILNEVSKNDDIIYSHINGVSQTNHDTMISDRYIVKLSTDYASCPIDNFSCIAFNRPLEDESIDFFKENKIKYFLLMKPNSEGNTNIDNLVEKFSNNIYYKNLFNSNDAYLFELI